MSDVTAVIVIFSGSAVDGVDVLLPPLIALHEWLRWADLGQLVAVDYLSSGWKHPGITCLRGGFNHLDAVQFAELFREQEWRHPEQAVLVLTTEDEASVVLRPPQG